jgi:hypothetical protein
MQTKNQIKTKPKRVPVWLTTDVRDKLKLAAVRAGVSMGVYVKKMLSGRKR